MKRKSTWTQKLNLVHFMCDHLLGKTHTVRHRMFFGLIIMATGVLISKIFHGAHTMVYYCGDLIGYLIHGIGATPFIEYMLLMVATSQVSEEKMREAEEAQREE